MFFRTTAGDRAYQVNVDHLDGAGIGSLYGEGFTTEWRVRPYLLSNNGLTATKDPASPFTPIFDLTKWSTIWNPTGYNQMRARVEGNPPHIQVWISNTKVMDASDTQLRPEIDASGPLAIQVHMGARWAPGGAVRYRNIRAKDLTIPCATAEGGVAEAGAPQPDGGAAGSAGAGGSAGSSGAGGSAGTGGSTTATGGSAGSSGSGGGSTGSSGAGGASNLDASSPVGTGGSSGAAAAAGAAPAEGSDSGGCACKVAAPRRAAHSAPVLLLLAALACLHRRRGARSVSWRR